jgi:hypothetical protein
VTGYRCSCCGEWHDGEPVGQRPLVELEPTDHPLAVEQREGITIARVQEFAELLQHPAH